MVEGDPKPNPLLDVDFTETELLMAQRFVGRCCVLDPKLIIPMRILCDGFKAWGSKVGHEPSLEALRWLLESSSWAILRDSPMRPSRIKCMVHGVGFLPTAFTPTR